MPFFSPKTWKQRIVEFPGRRRLDDTSSADVYDVSRAEGTVTQEGDGFTASNMNDLEQRINNAVNDVAGLSADEYDPNATYSSGDLRIHDNILHKAKQDISVAETWTPDHWDPTTLAAELSSLSSSLSTVITTDLNNIKTHICGYATSNTPNRPNSQNGYFECFTSGESDPSIVFQRYTAYGTHNVYIRWLERGSSWGDWILDE